MSKSEIRILPPLVSGKVLGVLEFGVDYVEITEKIFENEDSNFLVQIIWWGETKPLLLRSKKIKFFTKDSKQVIVDEWDGYIVKYEVRTKTQLFKSYLSKCDEIAVTIVDSVKKDLIGSTLLKDLIHLVYNAQQFTSSIINDSGDVIGNITCHFKFCESDLGIQSQGIWKTETYLQQANKCNSNDLKINLNLIDLYPSKDDFLNLHESSRKNAEKSSTIHYNSPVTGVSAQTQINLEAECIPFMKGGTQEIGRDSLHLNPSQKPLEICGEQEMKCVEPKNGPDNGALATTELDSAQLNKKNFTPTKAKIYMRKEEETASRTRHTGLKHSARVISKKTMVNNVRDGIARTLPKNKLNTTDRIVRGAQKDNGVPLETLKVKSSARVPKCYKISVKPAGKTIGTVKTFAKVSNEISKLSKLYLKVDEQCKEKNHSDLEKVPVKEDVEIADNTKDEDNGRDLNEHIQSPARITLSYKHSASPEPMEYREGCNTAGNNVKNCKKINVNNKLFFYLDDPIEKLYYETFFQKPEVVASNGFEIAELLNHIGTNYVNEESSQRETFEHGVKHLDECKLQTQNDVDVHCRSLFLVDVKRTDGSSNDEELNRAYTPTYGTGSIPLRNELESCSHENSKSKLLKEYKMDCHRCKYYKKLSELDKIIAALKNFETKLRTEVNDESENILGGDHLGFRASILTKITPENENTETSVDGDMGINSNDSDYSKEDSDFIEFRRYLSKR